MGTSLDTGQRASGPPSVKLRAIGDHVNFAVIDIDNTVPKTKFGTNEPDRKANGEPKLAVRLTILVTGGVNPKRVENDVDVDLAVGDVASIFIDSYSKWDPDNDKQAQPGQHISWGGALERDLKGDLQVGACGQYAFLREIASTQAGNNARKDRKFVLRPAKPEEAAQTQRCEQLRVELAAERNPATQLPTNAPAGPAPDLGNF